MHNLKEIRKNFSEFAKSLEKRSVNVDFANLEKLDELNRELIQKKESLENEKKRQEEHIELIASENYTFAKSLRSPRFSSYK